MESTQQLTGADVFDDAGHKIGVVTDVVFDEYSFEPVWAVVTYGLFHNHHRIAPAGTMYRTADGWLITSETNASANRQYMYGHSLLRYLNDGLDVGPGLVESWEVNEDASEWTLHFREGLRWSDGEPWTTADIMFWWVADTPEQVQGIYSEFRRTRLGRASTPVWSVVGLHRPAEFNRGHVPAFLAGEEPRDNICVYPFVRSYDWYLLPDEDRRRMLADHGKMARGYPDVRANTVASFSLGDYEWLLAFEADELYRIVDLMRHLRASEARMHVREEVPFFTGRRKSVAELVAGLA